MTEGIELLVHSPSDLVAPLDIIARRWSPKALEELNKPGGGSFQLRKDDPILVETPDLLSEGKVIRVRVGGKDIALWEIQSVKDVLVGDNEESTLVKEYAGPSVYDWLSHAVVLPEQGVSAMSDDRSFNYSNKQGSWYKSADWIAEVPAGVVWDKNGPWGPGWPHSWPKGLHAYWIWDRLQTKTSHPPAGEVYFRREFTTTSSDLYRIVATADDMAVILIDGVQVMAITEFNCERRTFTADVTIPAGNHVMAVKARQEAAPNGSGNGPAGLLLAMCTINSDTDTAKLTDTSRVLSTGDHGWLVNGYPPKPPGWTIGGVLKQLWTEACARGVDRLQDFTLDFTETTDSYGQPWADTFDPVYKVGTSLSEVFQQICDAYADVWITPDLKIHVAPSRGVDRSVSVAGADPVAFRRAQNVTDAATDSTAEITNVAFVKTSTGLKESLGPQDSISQFGRRETFLSAVSASEQGTAQYLVGQLFEKYAQPRRTPTISILAGDDTQPWRDFSVGDWVLAPSDLDPDVLVKRRVVSISTTEDSGNGLPEYTIEIDTIQVTFEERVARWLKNLGDNGNSGTVSGTSTSGGSGDLPARNDPTGTRPIPVPADDRIPTTPGSFVAQSDIVVDERGVPVGVISGSWTVGTLAIDDTDLAVRRTDVYYRLSGTGDYKILTSSPGATFTFRPVPIKTAAGVALQYDVYAVAIGENAVPSAPTPVVQVTMSDDTTPPVQPSTPTVQAVRGVFTVFWDGLDKNAVAMASDFDYATVELQVGTAWNRQGTIGRGSSLTIGGLSYGQHTFRVVAYDKSHNASVPSVAASATSVQLVTESEFADKFTQINSDIGSNTDLANAAATKAQQGVDDAATAKTAADQAASDAAAADLAAGNAQGSADAAQSDATAAQQRADELWAKGANLLSDAGFESGSVYSDADGTVSATMSNLQIVNDPTKAHTGNSYLEMTMGTTVTGYLRSIPVVQGRTYRVGMWVFLEAAYTSGNIGFGAPFNWLDANGAVLNTNWPHLFYPYTFQSKLPIGAWTYAYDDITPPPGAVKMSTRFFAYSTVTPVGLKMRFDDLIVSDVTEAVAAQTAADAAQATADTAKANAATALGTAITGQAYSLNPSFEDWSGTLPDHHTVFGVGPTKETTLVRLGSNAARFANTDITSMGLNFNGILDIAPNMEYFTVELVFQLVSGALNGAGVLIDWVGMTNNRATMNLSVEFPNPQTGKWYKITKVMRRPTDATGTWTGMDGYLMGNWNDARVSGWAAKDIIYDWLNIRPASAEEITAYGAPALITAVDSKATQAQSDATKGINDAAAANALAQSAKDSATAAQSTADGKTTVSINAPTTGDLTGKPANAMWTRVVSGKVVGAWYKAAANSSTWTSMPFDPVMIPQIDIGAGTFGDLDGVRMKAKSVATQSLMVGDYVNLIPNGWGDLGAGIGWSSALVYDTTDKAAGVVGSFKSTAGQGTVQAAYDYFNVQPGEEYLVEVWLKADKPNSNFYLELRDQSGAMAGTPYTIPGENYGGGGNYPISNLPVPTAWTVYRCKFVISATAYKVRLGGMYFNHPNGTERTATVGLNVMMKRRNGALVLVDGAVKARTVDANDFFADNAVVGKLNAQTGTFLTNDDGSGTKSTVTGQGLAVTYTDPITGAVQDRVKVGTFTEDYVSLADDAGAVSVSMNKDGVVSSRTTVTDDIVLAGQDINDILNAMPRGIAAWGQFTAELTQISTLPSGGGDVGMFEIGWDTSQDVPDRMYNVTMSPLLVMVTPNSSVAGTVGLRMWMTTDGSQPKVGTSQIVQYQYTATDTAGYQTLFLPTKLVSSSNGNYIRVLFSLYGTCAASVYGSQNCTILVNDLGTYPAESGVLNATGGVNSAPPKINYVKTYKMSDYRSWTGGGTIYNEGSGKLFQGLSPAGFGDTHSMAYFPSMTGDLSGATITKIRVYAYFDHWYYNSGGTARIGLHGAASKTSTYSGSFSIASSGWPNPGGRWVTLPSSTYAGFKSGQWRGVSLMGGDNTYTEYGYAHDLRIEVSYSK